jgi:hypothetical protein
MLKQSDMEYQVCILNTIDVDFNEERPSYLNDIDIYNFEDKYMEMDLIVMMGAQVHNSKINEFKKDKNKRFIGYKCGNSYIVHLESVIFGDNERTYFEYEDSFDELWYVPQQHETNYGYFSTLYRTKSFAVPFIWHQKFLYQSVVEIENNFKSGRYKKGYKYNPENEKKYLAVMEPNINIVKYSMIPTMIAEESYRTKIGKQKIQSLMISNADKLKNNKEFLSVIRTFDLYKDGKITAESRFQTPYFLSQYADILISHQILNPLN